MHPEYEAFLARKKIIAPVRGLDSVPALAPHLFPFQRSAVEFGLRVGSWGCFFDTGLGKTEIGLEWSHRAAEASNGRALVLTPLAVARQYFREGERWGYPIRVIREQSDSGDGINVCNYDRLDKLDADSFGAVVLDESSILKSFTGKTTRALIDTFSGHRWRMCATATPAPNDHMEIGTHSEFLGIMPQADMLIRWFVNDSADTGNWRLKGHARASFWDWMSSWCRMAGHPRDMGDDTPGYDLPPYEIIRHQVETSGVKGEGLFGAQIVSATEIHRVKRQTAVARAEAVNEVLTDEPWIIWSDTDYEQDALKAVLGDGVSDVRGKMSAEAKEDAIDRFLTGECKILSTKPSVCGFGLNFQHCANVAFVGRSFSYESWYQAVRRVWRFGQTKPVKIHLFIAEGEDQIGRVLDRKAEDHGTMKREMYEAMRRSQNVQSVKKPYEPTYEGRLPSWL